MSYRDILKPQLRIDEGERFEAYRCTAGVWTIGVGHTGPEVVEGLRSTKTQNDIWFERDIDDAEADARRLFPGFDKLSDNRKAVVVNMAFNLGHKRLKGFVNTVSCINKGSWAAAAAGMRNSLWAKQVGARAERLAKLMEQGGPW